MSETVQVRVRYFAVLREQRGIAEETVSTAARTSAELYAELQGRHGFSVPPEIVRAAVNDAFAEMSRRLVTGDIVVFIPPVAGG